jgi:hypothetical protein
MWLPASSWPAPLQPLCLGREPKAKVATLGMRRLTHIWKKGSFSLCRLAQRWNGSKLEERTGSQYNIIPVVLGSTTLCASITTICMWLTLYLRMTNPRSSFRVRLKTERGMKLRRAILLGWFCRGKNLVLWQAIATGAGLGNSTTIGIGWTRFSICRSWWGGWVWSRLKEQWHMGRCQLHGIAATEGFWVLGF